MEAKAVARFVRIPPRKARFVIDAIRGKNCHDALAILKFTPNTAARTIEKLLKSAIANAENNHHMNADVLKVSQALVDDGPTMKRVHPRAMGRAFSILKRSSHITLAVTEGEEVARRTQRKQVAQVVSKAKPKRGKKADTAPAPEKAPKQRGKAKAAEQPEQPVVQEKPIEQEQPVAQEQPVVQEEPVTPEEPTAAESPEKKATEGGE